MTNLTYKNVTPAQIAQLRAKLTAGGATITPKNGAPTLASDNEFRVTGHGITSDVTYEPTSSTLSVDVVSKPWIVPISAIDNAIKAALQSS
jgi:hypothetical protein